MKTHPFLANVIANNLLVEQQNSTRKQELHGKLSGSALGHPLQDQILHIIGVPGKNFDSYVLGKMKRGIHVEDYLMTILAENGLVNTQESIIYRGVTGHIDALVDMAAWGEPELGIIPHEIKSITNADWNKTFGGKKWKEPEAKWSHKLQAGLYALALDADYFMLHYVASDDYRINSLLYETDDVRSDIDDIITEVEKQLATGLVPEFVGRETWNNNKDYQNYPTWSDLSQKECMEKLEIEYPDAYQRLLSFRKEVN